MTRSLVHRPLSTVRTIKVRLGSRMALRVGMGVRDEPLSTLVAVEMAGGVAEDRYFAHTSPIKDRYFAHSVRCGAVQLHVEAVAARLRPGGRAAWAEQYSLGVTVAANLLLRGC